MSQLHNLCPRISHHYRPWGDCGSLAPVQQQPVLEKLCRNGSDTLGSHVRGKIIIILVGIVKSFEATL